MRLGARDFGKTVFAVGCLAVLLINLRAFSTGSAVPWDGRDHWFFFLWMGSSLRAHHFPDWMPQILSGYPLGSILPLGLYNPVYLTLSYLFPDSPLSINLLQLIYQFTFFGLTYAIARTHRLSSLGSAYAALAFTISGFVMGHASQTALLASVIGWLMLYLGIRLALQGSTRRALGLSFTGSLHLLTAGYPSIIVFGFQVLLVVFWWSFVRHPDRRKTLGLCVAAGLFGVLLSTPALVHFFNWIRQSSRSTGLTVPEALWGSLPPRALLNLLVPWMSMGREQTLAIDPTMDRFHLLATTPLFMLIALVFAPRPQRARLYGWFALGLLFLLLALGQNDPLGLRAFLTRHLPFYRYGRFPSADHRAFALFVWALLGAAGAEILWARLRNRSILRALVVVLVILDFAGVAAATLGLRYTQLPPELRNRSVGFRVEFSAAELNRPRLCDPQSRYEIEEWTLLPDRFSWHGLHNFVSSRYMSERASMAWALCGSSRLWDTDTRQPLPYELRQYSPGRVHLTLKRGALTANSRLLWAEVNDGFWKVWVNGVERAFQEGPALLRYIPLIPADVTQDSIEIDMTYAGPLSRFWR